MEVYRLVFEKFADQLYAPGFSGRWNYEGEYVIYAASSRSLASMENMVHKMGQGILGTRFIVMVLDIPDLPITTINLSDLPPDWKLASHYADTQPLGSAWYQSAETLLLKVPSAVVPTENNFVINARHLDFKQVQIKHREPLVYDYRFVAMDKQLRKNSFR
ncbi:RES domain-containing protein [Adhaeribacter arboris]|uniref:RES domain-containing protein n=1 Tax=Adhaeribacter arboris TaxID=2072846 RepID=A0A2T2YNL9_9BACT|nr:RES family NAD+ phosphorylase [Adhaeribacter arboris]PSR57110.1 RES domain-containing protein [Adhaeribacter arboris]